MDFKTIVRILVIASLIIFLKANLMATEITESNPVDWSGCKPIGEKELQFIKSSQNPKLLTGAALISSICPDSSVSRTLLELASRIETPKGLATLSLIEFELGQNLIDSPLKPSAKESISKLLRDDKDNAQSYYLYSLVQQEVGDQEALAQIIKGNAKKFRSYSKQRFNVIVEAAEMSKLSGIQARHCAFSHFFVTRTYSKLRQLCNKLVKSKGQPARNACFVMGEKLEQGSLTFVEQFVSIGIQRTTLDDLNSASDTSMAIKKRVDNIDAIIDRNACMSEVDVPEDALLHFYNILLNEGETAAQNFLYEFTKRKQDKN